MNEHSMKDWYRLAQDKLTGVALAVQRQDELNLEIGRASCRERV